MTNDTFSPPLDAGIARHVEVLRAAGIETFESCQGGEGHSYAEPTVRFHGDRSEGFKALSVALQHGLLVSSLRRIWPIIEGEPTGPWWELTFHPAKDPIGSGRVHIDFDSSRFYTQHAPPKNDAMEAGRKFLNK